MKIALTIPIGRQRVVKVVRAFVENFDYSVMGSRYLDIINVQLENER